MGDPFSATGSAVGIVSLGLQIAQGLIWYCGSVKGRSEELRAIQDQAESLEGTLELLADRLKVLESLSPACSLNVRKAIEACATQIFALDAVLRNHIEGSVPGNAKNLVKAVRKRILYPFQRDTILLVQNHLKDIRHNLNTALQLLQIDLLTVTNKALTIVKNETVVFDQQIASVKQDTMNILAEHSQVAAIDRENNILLRDVKNEIMQLKQDIVKHSNACSELRLVQKPSLLEVQMNENYHLQGGFRDLRAKLSHTHREHVSFCSCPAPEFKERHPFGQRRICISRTVHQVHQDKCPLSILNQRLEDWVFHLKTCSTLLKKLVEFSLRISWGAGGCAISPSLTTRRLVHEDSPGFRVLDLRNFDGYRKEKRLHHAVTKAQAELQKLLHSRDLSPYDITLSGEDLFVFTCDFVCSILISARSNMSSRLLDATFELLMFVASVMKNIPNVIGGPGDSCMDRLLHAFCLFLHHSRRYQGCLMENLDTITQRLIGIWSTFVTMGYTATSDSVRPFWGLSSLEDHPIEFLYQLHALHDGPLVLEIAFHDEVMVSMLSRSKERLARTLEENSSRILEIDQRGRAPLHLAASWGEGCTMLIAQGADPNARDLCGYTPLHYALEIGCGELAAALLKAGCRLHTYDTYIHGDSNLAASEVFELIVHEIAHRQRSLATLAMQSLPSDVLESLALSRGILLDARAASVCACLLEHKIKMDNQLSFPPQSVYEIENMSIARARLLYEAGFRDIRTGGRALPQEHSSMVPLTFFLHMGRPILPEEILSTVAWMIEKGAQLSVGLPKGSGKAYHLLGYRLGQTHALLLFFRYSPFDLDTNSFIKQHLMMHNHDSCICHCSLEGCTFATALCKGSETGFADLDSLRKFDVEQADRVLCRFGTLSEGEQPPNSNPKQVASELVRAVTFAVLGLTHTCCDLDNLGQVHIATDEREEIHEEERLTIQLLEEMVAEFDAKYEELGVSLGQFSKEYWQPRMDQILRPKENQVAEERERLRRLGIVVEECATEASGSDEDEAEGYYSTDSEMEGN